MKKKITALFFVLALLFAGTQVYAIGGTYSEGCRMGELTKFSVKGMIKKSGEGQMLMGRDSTPYKKGDKTINPWSFSAKEDKYDTLRALVGEYVVIEYEETRVNTGLSQDTPYTVKKVYPVTRGDIDPPMFEIPKPDGSKSEGTRVGRIVKASLKGTLSKTWEIVLQQGNAGNTFKHMTIQDENMYNYAVKCLKSAKKVTIHYVEDYVELMAETGYKIWKIEQVSDI